MIFRLALILVLAGLALWVLYRIYTRVLPRLAADPRMRALFSGVGLQMLRLFLLRRGIPLLFRLLRSLRFLRF